MNSIVCLLIDYSSTIHRQIKKMIALGQCCGIRYKGDNDRAVSGAQQDLLVAWFLTYLDGSMGVLFTDPVSYYCNLHRIVLYGSIFYIFFVFKTKCVFTGASR